ncbi:MAG TPA: NAD(P)-dependent oxidoreductase [Geminicoccaceae bacterium]|nr:NAD(P)-dependent oxidoreductase [Geminicoccaceae bacterium]
MSGRSRAPPARRARSCNGGASLRSETIGCIGLGVMGEPICAHLLRKSGCPVAGFDLRPEPLARLSEAGLRAGGSVEDVGGEATVVLLSLPGGPELAAVGAGLLGAMRQGAVVVDLSTAPVDLTRELAARFAARGVAYADAPVARTRLAAERGELSVMVGADRETFARIEPLLRCFASDILHCGGIGTGQVAKLLNNMVLFEIGGAVAEALAIGRQSGIEPAVLLEALANGSADSFCLRHHGRAAMLPSAYPQRAFSARYALKDLEYALALAARAGIEAPGARLARTRFLEAIAAGDGDRYWPVIAEQVGREGSR